MSPGHLESLLVPIDADLRRWSASHDRNFRGTLFVCPNVRVAPAAATVEYRFGRNIYFAGQISSISYGFNEVPFGAGVDRHDPRRLRGHLVRVRDASKLVVLGDYDPAVPGPQLQTWAPSSERHGLLSLADALDGWEASAGQLQPSITPLDYHGSESNYLLADGHVKAASAANDGLEALWLVSE
jgi:prepilin-type processing-associated H-X9-DG protein